MIDLQKAEEELAEKNKELALAQAKYDAAMKEKQVRKQTNSWIMPYIRLR